MPQTPSMTPISEQSLSLSVTRTLSSSLIASLHPHSQGHPPQSLCICCSFRNDHSDGHAGFPHSFRSLLSEAFSSISLYSGSLTHPPLLTFLQSNDNSLGMCHIYVFVDTSSHYKFHPGGEFCPGCILTAHTSAWQIVMHSQIIINSCLVA